MSTQHEEWRDVEGYEGFYQVSNTGKVRSLDRYVTTALGWSKFVKGTQLKAVINHGYEYVNLYRPGTKPKKKKIHRLVALAFVSGRSSSNDIVCHKDGNPRNNHFWNLKWGDNRENQLDSIAHGTHVGARKVACVRGHALDGANLDTSVLKERGHRLCRACMLAWASSEVKRDPSRMLEVSNEIYAQIIAGLRPERGSRCKRGHEYTLANLERSALIKNGHRKCLSCATARWRNTSPNYASQTYEEIANNCYVEFSLSWIVSPYALTKWAK